jgi:DNA-binding CsgD family transcriptional regulator
MPISSFDAAKVLGALHRLNDVRDVNDFPAVITSVAAELVPSVNTAFGTLELSSGQATTKFNRPVPLAHEEFMKRWSCLCHQHPTIKAIKAGIQTLVMQNTDFVSQREFRKTAVYNELFKFCGCDYQILAILPVPGHVVAMAINRDSDFIGDERHLIETLHPHFAQAFRNAQLFSSLKGHAELDFRTWRNKGFTRRECEVLQWLMAGKRDREIAVILGAGVRTIGKHVENIRAKFQVETRVAAAAEGRKLLGQAPILPKFN